MAESLQKLAAWAPESVFYGTTASFTESTMTDAGDRYTEIMADTKIALAWCSRYCNWLVVFVKV